MPHLDALDWWGLFGQFLLLSLMSIGGAISTVPEMHRYLVHDHHWLDDETFSASVAIAQAAPGPNLLFIAVLGWNVGGLFGTLVTMTGILIPSTTLAMSAARWGERRKDTRGVRAFVNGLAPVTVGLVVMAGWVLAGPTKGNPWMMALVPITVAVMLRTKLSPLWLIAAGAVVGAIAG